MRVDTGLDARIEESARRLERHKARLAALADHPDGRPAGDLVAKLIESEERFHASLLLMKARPSRRRGYGDRITLKQLAVALVVVGVLMAISHFAHLHR